MMIVMMMMIMMMMMMMRMIMKMMMMMLMLMTIMVMKSYCITINTRAVTNPKLFSVPDQNPNAEFRIRIL